MRRSIPSVKQGSRPSMTALRPYPAYKDSGVEWLGEVPEHWEVRRLKGLLEMLNGATPTSGKSEYWNGDILWITPDDLGPLPGRYICSSRRRITRAGYRSCGTTLAPVGSTVVSTRAPIGHLAILNREGCANQGCRLLVPKRNALIPEWTYFGLLAARRELQVLGQGTTFAELSRVALGAFGLPLPPLPEQTAIARFLDHADRRIRRYIHAKERLIELLEEQKQAIIHQAVTGQIDVRTGQPYPAHKDSGVEWLAEVPDHWEVTRARYIFREIDRRSRLGLEQHLSMSQKLGLVPSHRVENRTLVSESYAGGKLCQIGDLVLNRLKAHLGVFALAQHRGVVSPDYTVLRLKTVGRMEFFERVLRSSGCRRELKVRARGIVEGFWRLYTDDFNEIRIPVPPLNEQVRITTWIQSKVDRIVRLMASANRQIEFLSEYRTRLIADVVTGKLDVREAAASLPDVDRLDAEDTCREPESTAFAELEPPDSALQPAHP